LTQTATCQLTPEAPEYCLFHSDKWWLCLTRSEWASWIQAIAAALGVVAAIWVVWYQLSKNRKAEFERDARRVEAHAALLEYGAAGLHVILLEYESGSIRNLENIRIGSEQLEQVKAALDRFQLETGRSDQEIQSLLAARDTAASTLLKLPVGALQAQELRTTWGTFSGYAKILRREAAAIRKL
jgi:hypothetical protein